MRHGAFNPSEKNSLTRHLCITLMALTDKVGRFERDQIAVKLVERYPLLKGSFGMGYASTCNLIKMNILVQPL